MFTDFQSMYLHQYKRNVFEIVSAITDHFPLLFGFLKHWLINVYFLLSLLNIFHETFTHAYIFYVFHLFLLPFSIPFSRLNVSFVNLKTGGKGS